MLSLGRKEKETIVIDGHIKVTVIAIKGNTVRLGLDAPASVSIHREEVFRERAGQNERAVPTNGSCTSNAAAGCADGESSSGMNGATDGPARTDPLVDEMVNLLETVAKRHAMNIYQTLPVKYLRQDMQLAIMDALESACMAGASEGIEHARRVDRLFA